MHAWETEDYNYASYSFQRIYPKAQILKLLNISLKILITKYSNSLQFQNIKLWITVHCFAYYTGANVDKTECNTLVSTDWTPLKDFWNTSVVFFPFTYSKILGDNLQVSLYLWYFVSKVLRIFLMFYLVKLFAGRPQSSRHHRWAFVKIVSIPGIECCIPLIF